MRLAVNSQHRSSGTVENYDFDFFRVIKNVKSMRLVSANFPKTIYPVIAQYNDHLEGTYGDTPIAFDITIPEKNYTGEELAAEIEDQLFNEISAAITVTYDDQTNKLTFTGTSIQIFKIYGNDSQTETNAVCELLGIGEDDFIIDNNESDSLPNQVNLSFPSYIYLNITFSGQGSKGVFDHTDDYTFIIPMIGNFLEYVEHNENSTFVQYIRNPGIDFERISVRIIPSDKTAEQWFSFYGVNHTFILELNTGAD